MTPSLRRRRGRSQGFTLIEVCLALIVFLMMTLMFAAVFPVAIHAGKVSNSYAQAALMAQNKIDQLRGAGIDKLRPTSDDFTKLTNFGFIDQPSPVPISVPYTVYFTNADDLVPKAGGTASYFPAGSVGRIDVIDYSTVESSMTGDAKAPGQVYQVTVTITWPGQGGAGGSYSTSALLVSAHPD